MKRLATEGVITVEEAKSLQNRHSSPPVEGKCSFDTAA